MKNIVFMLLIAITTNAQNISNYSSIEVIESLIMQQEDDNDLSQLYDYLNTLSLHPISINEANKEDLNKFLFLSSEQIENLLSYRIEHGEFKSIYELALIENWDRKSIQYLQPFISIQPSNNNTNIKNDIKYFKGRTYIRSFRILEKQKGYTNSSSSKYVGDAWQHQVKFRLSSSKYFETGFTIEKDRGENYWNKGVDYISGFIEFKNYKCIKKIIIGDFSFKFGEGVAINSGFYLGKSNRINNISNNYENITRYSSGEGIFMSGIASQISFHPNWNISMFTSRRSIDATLSNNNSFIKNISWIGNHRTLNQINKKSSITHSVTGSSLSYFKQKWNIGLLYYQYSFQKPYLYNKDKTPISIFNQTSFSAQYQFYKGFIFSETTLNNQLQVSSLSGINLKPLPRIKFSILYRNYSSTYSSLYSRSFSENLKVSNERGLYFGMEYQFLSKWQFMAYVDSWTFPKNSIQNKIPFTSGFEQYFQLNFDINNNDKLFLRYKRKNKEGLQQKLRLQLNLQASKNIQLNTRLEWNSFNKTNNISYGQLLAQDIIWTINKSNLKFYLRYAYTNAPNLYNNFYLYENDVLYTFTSLAYTGLASKYYILLKYKLNYNFQLWIKYGKTQYYDRSQISSSYEQIDGNIKSEIRLQLQWKFSTQKNKFYM